MDLAKIKERLNALNAVNQNGSSEYEKNFWVPPVGKSTVRIVPSKFDKDNPFKELTFHNVKGMFRFPVLALTNFGKQDPIEEFREQLRNLGGKDNWSMSGKLTPRARWMVPVIVRGEEDKGVRLWNISQTIYKALLSLAADDEIGDFTDVLKGTDMVVEKTAATTPGAFPEITVRAKRNSSALSEDAKQVETWLNEQPDPLKCFRECDYDFIKKGLQSYLTGGASVVDTAPKKPVVPEEKKSEEPSVAPAKPVAPAKLKVDQQTVSSKFDDLFGEDTTETDQLPF